MTDEAKQIYVDLLGMPALEMFVKYTIDQATPNRKGGLASIITLTETGSYNRADAIITSGATGVPIHLYPGPRLVYGFNFTIHETSESLLIIIKKLFHNIEVAKESKIFQLRR